ncbi:hypothetical protein Hamer_G024219 [Homarus americanus]|uniref:Transmembrane protein n=1 Tax=Homarus americanus TaxID=6706 RepID=A0A8J5KAM9_HOMAM|nr:hypothetical protein Hamer_G024219 [Homarus americanus]
MGWSCVGVNMRGRVWGVVWGVNMRVVCGVNMRVVCGGEHGCGRVGVNMRGRVWGSEHEGSCVGVNMRGRVVCGGEHEGSCFVSLSVVRRKGGVGRRGGGGDGEDEKKKVNIWAGKTEYLGCQYLLFTLTVKEVHSLHWWWSVVVRWWRSVAVIAVSVAWSIAMVKVHATRK